MIVNGHRQRLLGVVLAHAMLVQVLLDLGGLGHGELRRVALGLGREFLVQHAFAQSDAIVADINAGAGDELFDFRVRFPAETAQRDVAWARHR